MNKMSRMCLIGNIRGTNLCFLIYEKILQSHTEMRRIECKYIRVENKSAIVMEEKRSGKLESMKKGEWKGGRCLKRKEKKFILCLKN